MHITFKKKALEILALFISTSLLMSYPVIAENNHPFQSNSFSGTYSEDGVIPSNSDIAMGDLTIDPISDHVIGDEFTIRGSANIFDGELLLIEIRSANTHPGIMIEGGNLAGIYDTTPVKKGANNKNSWIYFINTTDWTPDTYCVSVTPVNPKYDVTAMFLFNLSEKQNPPPNLTQDTDSSSAITLQRTSNVTELPTSRSVPISGILPITAIGCIAVVTCLQRRE